MSESDNRWYLDPMVQFVAAQAAQTRRTRKPCVVMLVAAVADCGHTLREDKTAVMIDGKSHCVDCAFARVTA